MTKYFIILILFYLSLNSKDFTVATYNIENLFDLKKQGTEYKEYRPYTKYWNKKSYTIKLKNISKTINHLNSDIITLQEIESEIALKALLKLTPKYKYSKFLKNKNSAIGVAILSKYKIDSTKRIVVSRYDKYSRDILRATIFIDNKPIIIYVNHWRSKRARESKRVVYATALKNDIAKLPKNCDYIIAGDLNSNYDEYLTFKYDKRLNDTYGITGINQILNTTLEKNFIQKYNILTYNKMVHYNLWLDIAKNKRFSSRFRGSHDTPDHLILSQGLFDSQNISYKPNSFNVFRPNYLYKKNKIKRWNKKRFSGYSDHLPIYATFTTSKVVTKTSKTQLKADTQDINYLYTIEHLNEPIDINNCIVIYKINKLAIIKQKNKRAIMIYNPPYRLKKGNVYNITVNKIDLYNGLKEIKELSYIQEVDRKVKYKQYYLDIANIDIFDTKYQNEIVTNLQGSYKKGYLYFTKNNKILKIKLYFKNKQDKPKDGQNLTIVSGHISIYKSKKQLVIYNKNDFMIY